MSAEPINLDAHRRVLHWQGSVRCMFCGDSHVAIAPVIEWAGVEQPVDCPACGEVRACIVVSQTEADVLVQRFEASGTACEQPPDEESPF
jgi:uncharacterized Zn finger protein